MSINDFTWQDNSVDSGVVTGLTSTGRISVKERNGNLIMPLEANAIADGKTEETPATQEVNDVVKYSLRNAVPQNAVMTTLNTKKAAFTTASVGADTEAGGTTVEASAFAYNTDIKNVKILSNVTKIGAGAFYGCKNLQSVTFEDGSELQTIGAGAFKGCSSLININIEECNKLSSLGNSAFYDCSNLATNIDLSNSSIKNINDYTFYLCENVQGVNIPNTVTSIGDYAFYSCGNFPSIDFPDSITSIGKAAFRGTDLVNVELPNNLKSIGNSAFEYCYSLNKLKIPEGITTIGETVFHGCRSLKEITLPSTLTTIRDYAFATCSNLTDISIPKSVTSIGNGAFEYCINLTNVTLPSNLTTIGDGTFKNCSNLIDIAIPENISSIGDSAFKNTPWFDNCSSTLIINDNLIKYVGTEENIVIPEGITTLIGGWYSGNKSSVTNISLPSTLTTIGDNAFDSFDKLTKISIPESVNNIGSFAFYNCSSLESLSIPEGVTYLENCLVFSCYKLKSLIIPSTVTDVASWVLGYGGVSGIDIYVDNSPENVPNLVNHLQSGNRIHWNSTGPEDTVKLYLTTNENWEKDNARFALYLYDDNGNDNWLNMTPVAGKDNVYEVEFTPEQWSHCIFCRMNGSNEDNNWTNRWNQTNDLTMDGSFDSYVMSNNSWVNGNWTIGID